MNGTTAQVVISIAIIAGAGAFVWWFLSKSKAERNATEAERATREADALAAASGLPRGERPLCLEPNCQAQHILEEGDADNLQHVDSRFRAAYWTQIDAGRGVVAAIKAGMNAACWRRGSRQQTYDRFRSNGLIDAPEHARLIASLAIVPEGWGAGC